MNNHDTHKTLSRVGLAANGSAGSWDVAVDETVSGAEVWFLQIDGPTTYLYFEIAGPDMINRVLDFIRSNQPSREETSGPQSAECADELAIGRFGEFNVSLVWDRETGDRCFVRLLGAAGSNLHVALGADDLEDLANAFLQVREDLSQAGFISA
jgi:hypothetical protein